MFLIRQNYRFNGVDTVVYGHLFRDVMAEEIERLHNLGQKWIPSKYE